MARLYSDDQQSRYELDTDFALDRNIDDFVRIEQPPDRPLDQVSPDQLTANIDNFSLADAILTRFSADAARTITGFAGAKAGIKMIAFIGPNSLILAYDDAGSDAENRIITHSGSDITLTDGQLAIMTYDFTSGVWRAGELT